MLKDDNRDFDMYIRSMFEDAEEEVPSDVWDAVSSRLAVSSRRPAYVWWKRVAVGAAAIAAMASGIFLTLHYSTLQNTEEAVAVVEKASTPIEIFDGKTVQGVIADAVPVQVRHENTPKASVPDASTKEYSLTEVHEMEASVNDFSEVKTSGNQADTESDIPDSKASDLAKNVEVNSEEMDPFAAMQVEDALRAVRSRKFSVSIGGNTQTNSVSGGLSQSPLRAPSLSEVIPTGTTIEELGNSQFGIPLSVGLSVSYSFAPRWSVGVGLTASRLSRTFNGTYTNVNLDALGETTRVSGEINNSVIYVGVPLNIYYDVIKSPSIRFYTYGGGAIDKGISNNYKIHESSSVIHYSEKVKGVQFSAAVGMGVEFNLVGGLGVYVDPSMRYYIKSSQPKSIRTEEPLMMSLDVGLRFNFK